MGLTAADDATKADLRVPRTAATLGARRAAGILAFAEAQGLSVSALSTAPTVCRFLDDASGGPPQEPRPAIATLGQLENLFESLLSEDERRRNGAVYTPTYIVEEIVRSSAALLGREPASLLDPACGAGAFLLGGARALVDRFGLPLQHVVEERLVGFDVHQLALDHTAVLLELMLLSADARPDCDKRLHQVDTLLTPLEHLRGLAPGADGFDLVVTNPPYVKLQTLDRPYRQALLADHRAWASGSFSLAGLFTIRSHQLLGAGGIAGLITQNNLYTSLAGAPIREYLQDHQAVVRVTDFGHAQVFDKASAYTCLLFLGQRPTPAFDYAEVSSPSAETLAAVRSTKVPVEDLRPAKWRLAMEPHLTNLARIESMPTTLGAETAIRVGFATLKDSVFVVPLIRDGGDLHAEVGLDGRRAVLDAGSWRPCVKVADLTDPTLPAQATHAVVYPYETLDGRLACVAEADLRDRWPVTHRYLTDRRDELAQRSGSASEEWYSWGRRQSMTAPGPKLLTKTFSSGPNFFLSEGDDLFMNGYSVAVRPGGAVQDLDGLLALKLVLESDVMDYYARLTSFQIAGNYQCYQKNFIAPFGLPALDETFLDEVRGASPEELTDLLCERYGLDAADVRSYLDQTRT